MDRQKTSMVTVRSIIFRRPSRDESGFSLLEVLVAFLILTVSITVLLQAFGTNLRNARLAQQHLTAITLAESLMARLGRDIELEEGEQTGQLNETYRWRWSITRLPFEAGLSAGSGLQPATEFDEQDLQGSLSQTDPYLEPKLEEEPGQAGVATVNLPAYRIDLTVAWGDRSREHTVTLASLRLAKNPEGI